MSGVPISEVTAKDFIMVRAALVKRLGGANEALVWSRIEYRSSSAKHAHETSDGQLWWKASKPLIAEETGLRLEQVKLALDRLVEREFLLAEHHHGSDRTLSYSPVIIHSGDSNDGIPPVGNHRSIGDPAPLHRWDSNDVPLIETSETVETSTRARVEYLTETFETAWKHWPRKESKKKALDRFMALAEPVGVAQQIVRHGDAHQAHTPTQFVPHLTTWLNQERWDDPLPTPRDGGRQSTVDHGRTVDEMLQAEESGQLKVTA